MKFIQSTSDSALIALQRAGFTVKFTDPKQAGFRTPFGRAMSKIIDAFDFGAAWGFLKDGIFIETHNARPVDHEKFCRQTEALIRRWTKKGVVAR